MFYRGFRLLQRKRLILDTPTAKVRSAAMGLVEVNGLAAGPYTITAPITAMPCYFYRTTAWQLQQRGKNREWVKVADESLHVPFFLDDNTGRVLVDPTGAEMDIHRDFQEEFSNSFFSTAPEVPSNVASFLTRHGVSTDKKIKIEEHCIKPKNALFVLGTLAENPGIDVCPVPIRDETPANASGFSGPVLTGMFPNTTATLVPKRTFSWQTRPSNELTTPEIVRLPADAGPSTAAEMTQQQKIAAALTKAGITSPAAWAAAGVLDPTSALTRSSLGSPGNSAAGTAPAPEQFDLHPPVVLMKGSHTPAFFISWRSQKDVVQSLGWKSAAMIWGGPLLTLISVYVLLLRFGWL
jgi:hypothetical protein